MAKDLNRILRLEVPIIVRLAEKTVPVGEVIAMMPGTIIELPKSADSELELLVNNKVIGTGVAVKVGENFGIRINFIGDAQERIAAMGRSSHPSAAESEHAALADLLLGSDT